MTDPTHDRRETYRQAFKGFDPVRLMADPGIVRNRARIEATIKNAQAFLREDP